MDPGTIAQWASPFITFALGYLRRSQAQRSGDDLESQVRAIVKFLGARRVYLLRHLELTGQPKNPEDYAAVLAKFDGSSVSQGSGWSEAARYACAFLSSLGLVEYRSSEVVISDLGRAVLNSAAVRAEYSEALGKAART